MWNYNWNRAISIRIYDVEYLSIIYTFGHKQYIFSSYTVTFGLKQRIMNY